MANRIQSVAILSLLIIFGAGIRAQSPQPTAQDASFKAGTFSKPTGEKITLPQRVTNLQGFGAVGQIPKFGGGDFLINSIIFESSTGKIGIGTQAPGSTLSVNGQIETLSGGVKFPDGSVQTTAGVSPMIALTAVAHDATLSGEGTMSSPLRVTSAEAQRQPYATRNFQNFNSGNTVNILLTTVPSGKLLVIEQVTARCEITSGHRVYGGWIITRHDAASNSTEHNLVFSSMGPLGDGEGDTFSSSQNVRLYAAPATQVRVLVATSLTQGLHVCEASISGYLIDQP
jgi:hypothetical protein